jgi:hypothetical protein
VEAKKENLTKLLTLVKEIQKDPKNKWFKDALLADIFGMDENTDSHTWISKINMIEKYLSIDGFQVIDYSFIENERVRNQLICDNIEMSRHRLGKRTGKVDFEEFCRFATLQIEEMLNYFYAIKFNNDFQEIKAFISLTVPEKYNANAKTIGSITLWSKFEAFATDLKLKELGKFYQIINWLFKLRNEGSHRNSLEENKDDELLQVAQVRQLLGYVNFSTLTNTESEIYNKSQFVIFKRKKDFKIVEENLTFFSEIIKTII